MRYPARSQYRSASPVGNKRVVFNITGNVFLPTLLISLVAMASTRRLLASRQQET